MDKLLDIVFEILNWISELDYWYYWLLLPAAKKVYSYYKDREDFKNIFGFSWPKDEKDLEITAYSAQHILKMSETQSIEAENFLKNINMDGLENDDPAKLLLKEMRARIKRFTRTKKLLARAGYRELIPNIPEDINEEDEEY